MTIRQFDPVFSAALRNELEALADTGEEAVRPRRPVRAALARPQVWVSLVTAVALAVVTIGVLRMTRVAEPAEESRVISPLSRITDPADPNYVARSVQTLISVRGTGAGTHEFDVPASVSAMQMYFDCAPDGEYGIAIDTGGSSSGGCSRDVSGNFAQDITAGTHDVMVSVPKGTEWALLIIAKPAPTISTGPLLDPLAAVRDLRNPDALTGDTTPVLSARGTGPGVSRAGTIPVGTRLRAYFVCRPASGDASVTIGGVVVSGCMNSIAHWVDFTATTGTITARTGAPGAWRLLVVRAPKGAKDSPAGATLPYPEAGGTVLGRARGFGAPASGTYTPTGQNIRITTTCRGTGWLEVETGDGGTNTRGAACSPSTPSVVGFDGDQQGKRATWTVIPHGDISWTFQITDDD